tara:strand:- start:1006 stop:1953 length:948 start_codon:yes stop_codon:yes gene_type:complete
MLPSDLLEWDDIASESYSLKKNLIEDSHAEIRLFSSEKKPRHYSTAPYFYDGGVSFKGNEIHEDTYKALRELLVNENLEFILLKTRRAIHGNDHGFIKTDHSYFTFMLDLSIGEEKVWKNKLKSQTRNQVRKAEKQNFTIKFGNKELLSDFYKVISEAWRDLGTPTHSRKFYQLIIERMKEKAAIAVIYHEGKPVSCALLLMVDNVIYHPYSCSLNSYKSSCVNNLLYWEIIKYACENNFLSFDMGRSRKDQGTYKYKKSWGAEPIALFYNYLLREDVAMPSFDSVFYKYATTAWKFMPLFLANRLGPSLIKNIL